MYFHLIHDVILVDAIFITQNCTRDQLCDEVQRPVESTLSVHVLPVFPFQNDMNCTYVVSFHFLSFSGIEITESHYSHHLLFLGCLALKIRFCNTKAPLIFLFTHYISLLLKIFIF